jgi:hypothetical protein
MCNESKPIGMFIEKQQIDLMTTSELTTIMQISRTLNTLRCTLRFNLLLKKDYNKIFDFRNKTELLFLLISHLKEGTKIFFKDIAPNIDEKNIPQGISNELLN